MAEQASNEEHTPVNFSCSVTGPTPDIDRDINTSAREPKQNDLDSEEKYTKHDPLDSGAGSGTQGVESGSKRRRETKSKIKNAVTSKLKTTEFSPSSASSRREVRENNADTYRSKLVFLSIESTMSSGRLFIASLGNPPPYSSTRHSAGHILIKALQVQLQFPMFQKSKAYANGLTSLGIDVGRPEFNLWQSPSLMNVSGVALLKAYKTFMSTAQTSATDTLPGLIILYDEMETAPGQLRLRRGTTSAKGHNGLKSVQQTFQSAGLLTKLGDRFVKIGVGIGRPAGGSRASEDVSSYVLSQLTGNEKRAVDEKADSLVKMLEVEWSRMSA